MGVTLQVGRDVAGLTTLTLANDRLRLTLLPQVGGRIWSFRFLPRDRELLWQSPAVAPAVHPPGAGYDDRFAGGWDELFPSDAPTEVDGFALPDHGEWWTLPMLPLVEGPGGSPAVPGPDGWADPASLAVVLRGRGSATPHTVEKRVTLRAGAAAVEVGWRVANTGDRPIPAIFRLHPAMPVEAGDRFDLPDCTVTVEPAYSPGLAPGPFRWPFARTPAGEPVDLRLAPADGLRMFTATDLAEGWCALIAARDGLGLRFRFDPALLDRVAVFADFGGWRGLRTALLEPGLGAPTPGGWHRLGPGETFAASVVAEVIEIGDQGFGIGSMGAGPGTA